jgi:hypothetical protein
MNSDHDYTNDRTLYIFSSDGVFGKDSECHDGLVKKPVNRIKLLRNLSLPVYTLAHRTTQHPMC